MAATAATPETKSKQSLNADDGVSVLSDSDGARSDPVALLERFLQIPRDSLASSATYPSFCAIVHTDHSIRVLPQREEPN